MKKKAKTKTARSIQKQESKAKRETRTKVTRSESIGLALLQSKAGTSQELIEAADRIYTKAGGKSNIKATSWVFITVKPALLALGVASQEGNIISLKQ